MTSQTGAIGPLTKPDLLDALDLNREKFSFLLNAASLPARPGPAQEPAKGARRGRRASTHELITEYYVATGSDPHVRRPGLLPDHARTAQHSGPLLRRILEPMPDALSRQSAVELQWRLLILRDRLGRSAEVGPHQPGQ